MRLWEVRTGKLLKTWDFATSIKRVEFSPDGRQLLGVTEKRSGHLGHIFVYEINPDPEATQTDEQSLKIVCEEAKPTVAGFSYGAKYIISGHEDGTVVQWDAKTGELLDSVQAHEYDMQGKDIPPSGNTIKLTNQSDRSPMGTRPHILHHRLQGQDRKGNPSQPHTLIPI